MKLYFLYSLYNSYIIFLKFFFLCQMKLYQNIIVRLKEVMRYFNNIKFNKANPSVNFFTYTSIIFP